MLFTVVRESGCLNQKLCKPRTEQGEPWWVLRANSGHMCKIHVIEHVTSGLNTQFFQPKRSRKSPVFEVVCHLADFFRYKTF